MTASIQDVAQLAEVSVSTASRAFSRPDMVAPRTRATILKAADTLGFTLSRSAGALKSGKTYRIALLLDSKPSIWFNANVIEGLTDVLRPRYYDLSLYPIESTQKSKEFFETLPIKRNVDAVVVASFAINEQQAKKLTQLNIPIVGINTPTWKGLSAGVSIDDKKAMYDMTRYVISMGHERIAYVGYVPDKGLTFSANRRLQGFQDACQDSDRDVDYSIEMISQSDMKDDEFTAESTVSRLATLPTNPTAVCCQQDNIAIPLICGLRRLGFEVPRDVSVTGFDDSMYSPAFGLTTMRQDPADSARRTAQKLMQLIDGDPVEAPFETLPAELQIRSSVARNL